MHERIPEPRIDPPDFPELEDIVVQKLELDRPVIRCEGYVLYRTTRARHTEQFFAEFVVADGEVVAWSVDADVPWEHKLEIARRVFLGQTTVD